MGLINSLASPFTNLLAGLSAVSGNQGKNAQQAGSQQFLDTNFALYDSVNPINRKQRRVIQSKGKHRTGIRVRGKLCTIEEASVLAIKEQNLENFQAAIDIYDLILAKVPDYVGVYNNRGLALQAMKRFDEALISYDKAIALRPDHVIIHYNRGVTLQAMGRFDEALMSYDDAVALKPDFAEAYSNRGNILQDMQRFDDALISYSKAIEIRPDFAEAYNNQGNILQAMKQFDAALASYEKAIMFKPDYAEAYYNRGNTLQDVRRYNNALISYDKAVALKSDYAEAYNSRGNALQEMERFGDALISYDKAITLKHDFAEAYNNRGNSLQEMRRFDDALASYDKAIALKPDFAEAYNNYGATLEKMKLYDDALANYDKAITLKPAYADAYNNRGNTLVSKGDMQSAEIMFLKAIDLNPAFSNPLFSLSNIRKYHAADHADIHNIHTLLGKPDTSLRDREYLYFALGKIYDDCGLYDDAFECYRQANRIRNSTAAYNPGKVTETTNSIIDVFTKEFLAAPCAFASSSRSPLFIVGMPRSGTTLMANILSNHSSIATAGELPTITEFTLRLPELIQNGELYPQAVKHITPAIASGLIQDYEKRLRRDIGMAVPHVIDKYPLNFRHLGFISMLFPEAKIIHCTRHPLDTGLSNYFQRFALDYDYAFDLQNIGHFYGEYSRVMQHWQKVLPLKMIEVSYEDMIMNTEPMVRKTLDFLGLEWDERCLAPHTNPCAVETASNWQVRQPIYKQSVERWRHYEKHLAPLSERLSNKV